MLPRWKLCIAAKDVSPRNRFRERIGLQLLLSSWREALSVLGLILFNILDIWTTEVIRVAGAILLGVHPAHQIRLRIFHPMNWTISRTRGERAREENN